MVDFLLTMWIVLIVEGLMGCQFQICVFGLQIKYERACMVDFL